MTETAFFQDLAMLATVAGLVAVVFARFGWPKVLGYIFAGIIMSEHTWGGSFLVDVGSIRVFGQMGVVFLMFGMGLAFSARDIKRIRAVALPSAVFDAVVMIWLGYTIGSRLFGWSPVQSMFLGVAICDSATTLLAKVLGEMGWERRPFAKYVLGTSVCQDIICVGAIAVVTGFANGGGMSLGALFGSLGWLSVFFLSVLVLGIVLVPRLLQSIAKRKDDEALLLAAAGCCFLVSFLAYQFRFSLALGAFLVGVICSTSQARARIETLVNPFKSLFSAVFFVSIGLLVDPMALWHCLPEILIVSLVVVTGKLVNNTLMSLVTGLDVKTAVQNGFSLAQIGEFAFMVAVLYASIVEDAGNPMFQIAVGVSLLTTMANPLMIRWSDRVGSFVERRIPARLGDCFVRYRAWLDKIRASEGSPAFVLLKNAAVKLAVYAVLMLFAFVCCALLPKVDYARFSELFERYDGVFFYILANLFALGMVPLVLSAARSVSDELTVLLSGDGTTRWHLSLKQLVRFVILVLTMSLYFLEWAMINISVSPLSRRWQLGFFLVLVLVGVVGWRWLVKAGRRATKRFVEAVSAEERRDVLMQSMTMPEGAVYRLQLGANSPAVGGTVVTLNIRAKTGASIVSVYRDGVLTRNVGPEWEFRIGDVLVAIGEPQQVAALKDLLGII